MRYTDHLLHLKFIFCITNSQEESSKIFILSLLERFVSSSVTFVTNKDGSLEVDSPGEYFLLIKSQKCQTPMFNYRSEIRESGDSTPDSTILSHQTSQRASVITLSLSHISLSSSDHNEG